MAGYGYRRIPSYGAFPGDGTDEERRAWAEKTAALPKVTPEMVMGSVSGLDGYNPRIAAASVRSYFNPLLSPSSGPETPFGGSQAARNVVVAEQQARQQKQANPATRQNPGIVYRNSMESEKPYPVSQRATTPVSLPMRAHSSPGRTSDGAVVYQPTQYDKSRSVPGAAGTSEQRDNHPGAARYGTYAAGPTWFDVEGSNGQVRVGYWDVDGRRQTLVRHGTFPEKSQAQPQQPRGLHYVPGGWANDGYSFEGSAEDRARFFAPVSGPGRAPRSDNDTFLMLQRQKAMQPVEQPLPERPEFPADRRMGWHTKLAKYQADMDAYNRQMANIAGYRQAMDVAALQQMPKPTDPVEQARLERALALQERQAAQQSAYNQAQLDQQERMNQYNQMTGMADYFTKMNQLGYQQREAELVDNYRRALLAGDAKAADAARAVLEVYRGKEVKDDNKNGKFAHATLEDAMGNKKIVIYNTQTGESVDNANIPSMDTPEAVKMRQDNSAYLEEVKKRASPKQQEELAGLEPFINHPNFRAIVDEYMRKGR